MHATGSWPVPARPGQSSLCVAGTQCEDSQDGWPEEGSAQPGREGAAVQEWASSGDPEPRDFNARSAELSQLPFCGVFATCTVCWDACQNLVIFVIFVNFVMYILYMMYIQYMHIYIYFIYIIFNIFIIFFYFYFLICIYIFLYLYIMYL